MSSDESPMKDTEEDYSDDQTRIIVNYLPPSMSEEQFQELFSACGEISGCKLVVDKYTKHSLGYGFITFANSASAMTAIATLDGKKIENKVLKVGYARPPSKDIQHANLYVSHLDSSITVEKLKKLFSQFGDIIDCKILKDATTSQSKGAAFVRFDKKSQADAAIAALNGVQISMLSNASLPLEVRHADNTQQKLRKNRLDASKTFYQFGNDNQDANNQMYGMRYAPYSVYDYNAAYNGGGYNNVSQASNQRTPSGTVCLFVYNLPSNTDENLLYKLFSPYGAIVNVKVIRDLTNGNCKGFGFVHYLKQAEAQAAIVGLNGCQIGNKLLQVSFKSDKQK